MNVLQNSPPDITNLPDSGSFTTGTTAKTKLHDLTVTDPESDVITCTMSSTPVGPFSLEKNTGSFLILRKKNLFTFKSVLNIICTFAYSFILFYIFENNFCTYRKQVRMRELVGLN